MSIDPSTLAKEVTLTHPSPRVAVITIDRQSKLNALTQDHYFRIAQLLHDVAAMPDVFVTVVTGKGRFFSAGADVSISRSSPEATAEPRKHWTRNFVAMNLHNTHAWYTHPKILITALNGPAVGISAAQIAHSDFIYAAPHAYLLTPFSSLGLVAEGGASVGFVRRLGVSRAKEALLMSRKLGIDVLLSTGFVNKTFEDGGGDRDTGKGIDTDKFLARVLEEVEDKLGPHLVGGSLLGIKRLIGLPGRAEMDRAGVDEVVAGLELFSSGAPQREFARIASGEKRHKL